MEDKLEMGAYAQKQSDLLNAQLHQQGIEYRKEISNLRIPDGFTLVKKETLDDLLR